MSQKWVGCLFVSGCLILMLAGCVPDSPSGQSNVVSPATLVPSASPRPTATAIPRGTVLYQADWSHGLSGWQASGGWQVMHGQLEVNSPAMASIFVPYRLTVTSYALEMRIQVVRLLHENGGYFSIFAQKASGRDGYQAGVSDLKGTEPRPNGSHPQAQVFIDPSGSTIRGTGTPIDYEPGWQWHTYRVEVQDNQARLLVDDVQIGMASSDKTDVLSNGPLGLSTAQTVLRVSNLRIIAL
ncbi:MAG: DUF1080 domain-containing protein [Ktedonobacteraceae bacterium]|nr:DUF1080 domain-containing protein [Ktedonobacteraceae bacterium]